MRWQGRDEGREGFRRLRLSNCFHHPNRAMFDRTAMDFDPDDDPDTDAMETDPAHMATPPNSSTPTAISSPCHTPLSPAQTSPSPIVRQQSEIVGVSSVGARVSGLVRSQSVQVMPSSGVAGGGGVAAEGRGAVEGGGAEKLAQVNQKDAAVSRKRLGMMCVSYRSLRNLFESTSIYGS